MQLKNLHRSIPRKMRTKALSLLNAPQAHSFLPAPSVERQSICFQFGGRSLTVESGYSTPLYETIAEVVDFDCYQLARLDRTALAAGTIVDVGGNVGVSTLCFSGLAAQVVTFEPVPQNARRLRANVELNGLTNVTVQEKAITATNGSATFWVPEHEDVGGRVGEVPAVYGGTSIQVACVDLATALGLVPGPITLMKVDCEGGEYDLVAQMTPDIVQRVDALSLEVHERGPNHGARALAQRLEAMGYTLSMRPDPFGRPQLTHILGRR